MSYKMVTKNMTKYTIGKIGFGGASLSGEGGGYGFGTVSDPIELIHQAIDSGIKLFDTAPIYGFGKSEEVLGHAIKGQREKLHVVSKSGVSWHPTKRVNMTNDPAVARSMLETSLKTLNTEYIDIYMVHWPDPNIDIRYPLEVLENAKNQGKIKSIGLCNTNKEDLLKALEVCNIEFLQSECNLFNNPLSEFKEIIEKEKITTMGWGTFDKGILAGSVKLDSVFEKSDARSWAPWWKKGNWKEKVRKVDAIEKNLSVSIKEIALSYSLETVDIALCGFKKNTHLEFTKDLLVNPVESELIRKVLNEFRD